MTTRITGLATGMDIDALVSSEMSVYKQKVTTKQQEKAILEYKQTMYRECITEGAKIYDSYFDILNSNNLISDKSYTSIKFTSTNESAVSAKAVSGNAIKDNYSVSVESLASAPKMTLKVSDLDSLVNKELTINYNGKSKTVDLSAVIDSSASDKNTLLNNALKETLDSLGLKGTYSEFAGGIVIESKTMGKNLEDGSENTFSLQSGGNELAKSSVGTNLKATITSSNGIIKYGDEGTPGVKVAKTNNIVVDNVQFTLNSETVTKDSNGILIDSPIKLTGTNDASDTADKIIKFFDEYNNLITKLTKYTTDKHDRDYKPLSDDEKKEMSENEIKLWNEKVQKGLLNRDSMLTSILNQLKSAMSSSVSGCSINLEKIGITPVKDYGSKNGTFTIDKDKLKAALEENPEEVMKLFNNVSTSTDEIKKNNETGIMQKIKNILNDNFKSSTKSLLIKKAGIEGNDSNATITKEISKYATIISKLQSDLSAREQKLYSKYSKLETAMNTYNNQLSYLQSAFS